MVNGRTLGNILDERWEVRLITETAAPGRRSALDFLKKNETKADHNEFLEAKIVHRRFTQITGEHNTHVQQDLSGSPMALSAASPGIRNSQLCPLHVLRTVWSKT